MSDGKRIDYVLDAQNRRIGKKVNGVLTQGFLYQSQLAPAAELNGQGQVVSRFVYGTAPNVPEFMTKDGVNYRLLTDHLGSVRLVVNTSTGAIVQRLDYDEFGDVTANTNPGFQPFGYAGGLYDTDTRLVRFGARDYDAGTGRWTAKDPIGMSGGSANLYTYVSNDPISSTDPTGLLVVHVWRYRGTADAWGHASVTLDDGTHISWWPVSDDRMLAPVIGEKFSVYEANAFPNQTLADDIKFEGQPPDVEITITGLDEAAIRRWWVDFKRGNKWKTLTMNCSTVAADALKAGGANVAPKLLPWKPNDVEDLARKILHDLHVPSVQPDVTRIR